MKSFLVEPMTERERFVAREWMKFGFGFAASLSMLTFMGGVVLGAILWR